MVRKAHHGQVVGYRRVSTSDQNTTRQLEGVELDKLFEDKLSGKDTNRPQLKAMLSHVREGDVVFCHSLDRLGRNLDDLRKLVKDLTSRGVKVQLIRERQREGIALAKQAGVYRGRKPSLTPENIEAIRTRVAAGERKSALAAEYGVTRMTIYNALALPAKVA